VENGCQGGQGSPRAVAPSGWMDFLSKFVYGFKFSKRVVDLLLTYSVSYRFDRSHICKARFETRVGRTRYCDVTFSYSQSWKGLVFY
jgi:hypothetical protein